MYLFAEQKIISSILIVLGKEEEFEALILWKRRGGVSR
jgi:hypothetical protein